MPQFKMPQLGETVAEGTITRWLKKVGDKVAIDDDIVEVSTDKVDSAIPSPFEGTLTQIMAQEGETIAVGAVMAEIGAADAEPPAADARRAVLSPLVRKLASEMKVDLKVVSGTGAGGRITKQDILDAADGKGKADEAEASEVPASATPDKPPADPPDQPPSRAPEKPPTRTDAPASASPPRSVEAGDEELIQVTPMRKAIAEHMVASLRETARAWNTVEVDLTRIGQLRAKAGPAFRSAEGYSLTWTPFVAKAVAQTLRKYPQVNATWNGDGTITRKNYVNLGIAVALENGLIVPVVKGAEEMTVVGLSRAIRDIADRARTKKLSPDDVAGGTFTITNPGPFGSILSVPIINKGQAAILALDAVVKRPVVVTDENGADSIGIRQMVYVSMSWDHRVIDGAEASQFLAHLKGLLEEADFASELAGYLPEG